MEVRLLCHVKVGAVTSVALACAKESSCTGDHRNSLRGLSSSRSGAKAAGISLVLDAIVASLGRRTTSGQCDCWEYIGNFDMASVISLLMVRDVPFWRQFKACEGDLGLAEQKFVFVQRDASLFTTM